MLHENGWGAIVFASFLSFVCGSELRTVSGTDGTTDTATYCVQGSELTATERGIVIHATKR